MTLDGIVEHLEGAGWAVATKKVSSADGQCVLLVGIQAVEVRSNLVRPLWSVIVYVHETLGEQELSDCTVRAISDLRKIGVVNGARRVQPDRKYQRMEILLGGVSV